MDTPTIASLIATGLTVLIIALIIIIEIIKLIRQLRNKPVTGENQPLLTPTSQTLQNIEDKLNQLLSGLGIGSGLAPRFPEQNFASILEEEKDGQKQKSISSSSRYQKGY